MIITTVLLMLEMNQLGKEGEYGYTVWLHWLHCSSGAGEIVKWTAGWAWKLIEFSYEQSTLNVSLQCVAINTNGKYSLGSGKSAHTNPHPHTHTNISAIQELSNAY